MEVSYSKKESLDNCQFCPNVVVCALVKIVFVFIPKITLHFYPHPFELPYVSNVLELIVYLTFIEGTETIKYNAIKLQYNSMQGKSPYCVQYAAEQKT